MISAWKHYDNNLSKYETSYPPAFPWNREQREDSPRYEKGADGYWYDPKAKETGKALLSCVGDLMCEPRMTNAHRYGDSYFFHPLFQHVREILKSSDFSIANLETTLTDCTPYAGEYHRVFGKYHCNAPECYLDAVRYAGFDALVTANNHNCDSGLTGLTDTLNALDRHDFMHTGSFFPEEKERVLFVKINGIRVAILSYATYYNRLDGWHYTQEAKDLWLNRFSKEKVDREVAYARQKGAEFVMCYVHWGDDYDDVPNQEQYDILADLKESGVDYIVGSHTHCLQWHNVAVTEDGREIPMMYSMGNFVTNEMRELCKHTGILQLILRRENGKISIREYFIPCYVFDEMGTGRFCVVPADGQLNGGFGGEKMQQVRDYVRNRIGPDLEELPTAAIHLAEICDAMGTELPADIQDGPVTKLAVQVGPTCPAALYFSTGTETVGELRELRKRKLIAAVTEMPMENLPCILVPDVRKAYLQACGAVMARVPEAKRILIAGPEEKTTTRELITHVLEGNGGVLGIADDYQVDTAPWQNLHPYHEYCVQELREDNPMGVAVAVKAAKPHICVLTGLVDNLKDLVAGLGQNSLLLYNETDSELIETLNALETAHLRLLPYGMEIPTCSGLPMPDMKPAGAAAYVLGLEIGLADTEIRKLISQYRVSGYTRNIVSADGVDLVLNLNCKSVKSAGSAIEVMAGKTGRKFAIFGDFDKDITVSDWKSSVKTALDNGAAKIFCMGENANAEWNDDRIVIAADERDLERKLMDTLQDGDVLLICGGRKMNFNITLRRMFGLTDGFIPDSW